MDLQMVSPNQKMKLSSNHCDEHEHKDVKKFSKWNEEQGYFNTWTPNLKGSDVDIEAVDGKGRKYHIELKSRWMPSNRYTTYMIEGDKLADLLIATKNNDTIPLYINFFDDNAVAVWNLKKDLTITKDKRRRENTGAECKEGERIMVESTVYYLRLDEAAVTTLQ